MQTIKTAAVVVLMMTVLYGIFIALSSNEPALPPGLADFALNEPSMDIELGEPVDGDNLIPAVPLASPASGGSKELGTDELAIPQNGGPEMLENLGVREPNTTEKPDSVNLVDIPKGDSLPRATAATEPENVRTTSQPEDELVRQENPRSFLPVSTPVPNTNRTDAPVSEVGNSSSAVSATQGPAIGTTAPSGGSLIPAPPQLDPAGSNPSLPSLESGSATPLSALTDNRTSVPGGLPTSTPNPDSSAKPAEVTLAETSYAEAKAKALEKAREGKLKEALIQMSAWFGRAELTYDEKADLTNLLNALAAEVIYSRRHFLETSYKVGPRESLEDIAKLHGISTELLANINQVPPPYVLLPNTELKVLRGPFRAEVNLTTKELTLYLDNMYAGQFPLSLGSDMKEADGGFNVMSKQTNRNYYAANGGTVSHADPNNPYGKYWIDLGQDLCIHGSPAAENSPLSNAGCISLSPRDAEDVYNILTVGSKVTITK